MRLKLVLLVRMARTRFSALIALALFSLSAATASGVSLGQSDTFEDGTVQSWSTGPLGHPSPPANIATGGPGGADDNYLRLTALGGTGAGSRLAAFNGAQWSGNYLAAGITAISLHVNNFGPNEAHLRLRFIGFSGATSDIAITNAVVVPPGSGWSLVTFTIYPASLVTLQGSATAALTNASELRIFHNPAPAYPNPPTGPPAITVQLGIDNIRAVPEASPVALISLGLLALVALTRKGSARKRA